MKLNKLIAAACSVCIMHSLAGQVIPLDTAVKAGVLANGFTYYLRHNETPKNRVYLYLVNKVGSVLEDGDQQGLAHFMEHMNFNGTNHFPKNTLTDYLQKAGVRFGADVNAYTSFDETVYELPIPSDDSIILQHGFEIMHDWAQGASLDSTEIDKERGVVLEEARLGKGADERMQRQYWPAMLNYSRYSERIPIGKEDILRHFPYEAIRRFHKDWYRPDLQALVVVGDIDVVSTEKLIRSLFGDLQNPANEKPRIQYSIAMDGKNRFQTVTDREMPVTELEVLIKHRGRELVTEDDYLHSMKTALFNQMLGARMAELGQTANPPFTEAQAGIGGFMGGLDAFTFTVVPKQGLMMRAFDSAWQCVERVRRFGFTPAELARAKRGYVSNLAASAAEGNKTHSASLVGEYQRLFLHHEASPGIAWEYAFVQSHIDSISLADIVAIAQDYISDSNRDILLLAPDTLKNSLPDSATVEGWLQSIKARALTAYEDAASNATLMTKQPLAGTIVSERLLPVIGVTEIIFRNGIKAILKPTKFKNDQILFSSFTPGGTSALPDKDYTNASYANSIVSSMGVAGFSPTQLNKVLPGKRLSVGTYIGERSSGIQGTSSVPDFETALQLIYLRIMQPRKDSVLFANMMAASREYMVNRSSDPGTVFGDTIRSVLGGYHYRRSAPSLQKLDSVRLDKALDIYEQCLAAGPGTTFLFTGSFNIDSIKPLLALYIGGLPAAKTATTAKDLGIAIPAGVMTKRVFKGSEDKATARLVYSGTYRYNNANNMALRALKEVLQIMVIEHLREEASEVYSPSVQLGLSKYPRNTYNITVAFGCAPKNVDTIINLVNRDIKALQTNGPAADDIGKFKAEYKRTHEVQLQDNGFWLGYLDNQLENKESLQAVLDDVKLAEGVTADALRQAAKLYLSGKNLIRFVLLPENK